MFSFASSANLPLTVDAYIHRHPKEEEVNMKNRKKIISKGFDEIDRV
jgi:hypothetical protein